MNLKTIIRLLKTSPWLAPLLAGINLFLWAVDRLAVWTSGRPANLPNRLLIIRVDVLGDYLLFRNYLRLVRSSARYRNDHITLCASTAIQPIAEVFDHDVVDEFIWVDIYKLSTQPVYRFRFVQDLRRRRFSTAFCPTYSRVLVLDDFLVRATGAATRIGCATDYVNLKRWESWLGDRLYTRLIDSGSGIVFEMERNRRIMEGFLGEPVPALPPTLDSKRISPVSVPDQYIILSLGAGQDFRIWPTAQFAQTARHLLQQYPDHILVLTGAPNEKPYAEALRAVLANPPHLLDLTGKLSLAELIYVVRQASLLIANETGIVHIAASTGTPTLVISQGKTLVRWHPYAPELAAHIRHVYPEYLEQRRGQFADIAPDFNPESPLSITDVSAERVIALIDSYIRKPNRS
ncbi:glycosyltransferase family 9 protein [Larkinella rosea]|uniref:Lipopolysaccharide heptosyltransferase family protein n=1 Tax=Larkinella rosea TaxID=2025312 RepID=A0A3P1BC91_9BACT|nr:glycosyltransferase family 9 protein [Larkinella rosea]RRA98717.1 lipopolysaccharide heptosyltransferase family protein [Larkinella rosea]